MFTRPGFKFHAGVLGNIATGLSSGFVLREACGIRSFGNLPGGKFGERGEDELGFAHVIS